MSASHRTPRARTLPRLAVAVATVALGAVACSSGGGQATGASSTRPSTRATAVTATKAASTIVPNSTPSGRGAFLGPVRRIPVNGIRIGYRQFGSGPDLIMVMGDTGTMSDWTADLLSRSAATTTSRSSTTAASATRPTTPRSPTPFRSWRTTPPV